MSVKTGPITNIVRNSAIPVSTWFGGDVGRPSALRVSASTTRILVNEVTSSSTDGAIDSTVIARISVTAVLGLPPPTEMSTPLSTTGATGAIGAVGATGSPGGEAGPASSTIAAGVQHQQRQQRPAPRAPRAPEGLPPTRSRSRAGRGHGRRTVRSRSSCTTVVQCRGRHGAGQRAGPLRDGAGRRPIASSAGLAVGDRRAGRRGSRPSPSAARRPSTSASRVTCSSVEPTTSTRPATGAR